jgi:YidC/Oxa1 family membrane protein insertase
MLIQLPILWAVFYVFRDTALFGQEKFLGLTLANNINTADPLYVGIFFAVLSGATTFLSTWILTPKNKDNTGDATPNPMASSTTNIIMSAFFGWVSWTMPAGLVIYWIVNNLLQLGLQYFLNKAIRRKMELEPSR